MRLLLATMIFLVSSAALAGDLCSKYEHKERFMKALNTVATHQKYALSEMCSLAHVQDVEVQPSQVITPKGDVIPHVRVHLHSSEYSCLYMVRDADQVITSSRCYSTF
ncbi:hypothetical protein [Bdellovibrio reynosensis]|uniref:Uncharacterized protein n=1 Tax=Bdellovibrio reynosensis TaxID=2835041 RepID=A0ABY4CC43_9BACT|nr:hypothetical protein [Bdellovibrio reynosensis]UOF02542.1 hypothetical protein MNR06_06200 [Bdellovibrio reynosensis]